MKKNTQSANNRALFVIGAAFIPIGIATNNIAFIGVAVVFIILGLKNRAEEQQ